MYSSNLDDGFATRIPSERQQNDEEYDPTPGRYSELHPGPFQLYYERWIKYWPKDAVHVKRAYDGGFIQRKTRKGYNLYLFPTLAVEWAERHLDPHQWAEWKENEEPEWDVDHGPFWLGLHAPRKATVDCIDLDAKRHLLAYYRRWEDGPVRPLVVPDLDHFRTLKAIHDRFSGRIWCISSATLGVHAWRKHRRRWERALAHLANHPAAGSDGHELARFRGRGQGDGHAALHVQPGSSTGARLRSLTISTVSTLTRTTFSTRWTMYSGSSARLGSVRMPLRLSVET